MDRSKQKGLSLRKLLKLQKLGIYWNTQETFFFSEKHIHDEKDVNRAMLDLIDNQKKMNYVVNITIDKVLAIDNPKNDLSKPQIEVRNFIMYPC